MAEIKPFRALRFNEEKAGAIKELVCPPYDIISEKKRLAYLKQNEHNVIRLELPREGENHYEAAKDVLTDWLNNGILQRDEKPSLYIYEEEFTAYGQTYKVRGFSCLVKITPFEEGVVLPHEFTLSKAKADRFELMKHTYCNFSQVYSLYVDDTDTAGKINKIARSKPEIEFVDDEGIIQRLWTVTDEDTINAITKDFENRKLFIADGHHRYETSLNFRNYMRENGLAVEGDDCDYMMMTLVNMDNPGLVVFPTHRIIRDVENFDSEKLIESCREYFNVYHFDSLDNMSDELEQRYEANKKAFGYYDGKGGWTLLRLRDKEIMSKLLPDISKASQDLDVTVLHSLILERLLGIDKENMANQKNLTYVKNMSEAMEMVDKGEAQCAFILNPTHISQIHDVAVANEKMPQKSTYFYPKLITGLVMNQFKDIRE